MIENSIEDYQALLVKIRAMARADNEPSDILRYLAVDGKIEKKVHRIALFHKAFNAEIGKVSCIGGWSHEGGSELGDKQINEFLKPVLSHYVQEKS